MTCAPALQQLLGILGDSVFSRKTFSYSLTGQLAASSFWQLIVEHLRIEEGCDASSCVTSDSGLQAVRDFLVSLRCLAVDVGHAYCGRRPDWYLCIEEGLGNMAMVVVVEEDGAGARIALKGIHTPIAAVPHEIEAQLSRCACLFAEALHPLPDLQRPQSALGSHDYPQISGRVDILQHKWGPWGRCACRCCPQTGTATLPQMRQLSPSPSPRSAMARH